MFRRVLIFATLIILLASFAYAEPVVFKKSDSGRTSRSNRAAALTEVAIDPLILYELAKFEQAGGPLQQCSLITHPPLPSDFGLTAEVSPGVIDVYRMEYLSKMAQSSAYVRELADVNKIKWFVSCLTKYSSLVSDVLKDIPNRTYKSIPDFQKYIQTKLAGLIEKQSPLQKDIDRTDFNKCRFAGEFTKIQCGSIYVELSATPKLQIGKTKVFDPPVYMNLSSKFYVDSVNAKEIASAIERSTGGISE